MKFYTASVQIGSIPWALVYDKDNLAFTFEAIDSVYKDFFESSKQYPDWYLSVEEAKKL